MAQDGIPCTLAANKAADLRRRLVQVAMEWESHFGVAPAITSAISELDAKLLVGMKEDMYCLDGKLRTAVSKDTDFVCRGIRYQVTANRPSGKKGSPVTLVSQKTEKKRPFGWDRIIWILYDRFYVLQEAWEFTAEDYRIRFNHLTRLSPDHMRHGRRLVSESYVVQPHPENERLMSGYPDGTAGESRRIWQREDAGMIERRPEAMKQRDKMRDLYARHRGDKEKTCAAYARAEQAGEVERKGNEQGLSPEQYAVALWNDGIRKGWIAK